MQIGPKIDEIGGYARLAYITLYCFFLDMTHSQMFQKEEYGLPAKI